MFTELQKKALAADLNRKNVKQRVQGGAKVSYIEGWHAIDEANRIFGFEGWDRRTIKLDPAMQPIDGKDKNGNPQWRVAYLAAVEITVRAGETVITRQGNGFGSGMARELADAIEKAIKEAETDAMKRALMTFGNPFGLALYDKDQRDVSDDPPPPAAPKPDKLAATFGKTIAVPMDATGAPSWGEWGQTILGKLDVIRDRVGASTRAEAIKVFFAANDAGLKSSPKEIYAAIFAAAQQIEGDALAELANTP